MKKMLLLAAALLNTAAIAALNAAAMEADEEVKQKRAEWAEFTKNFKADYSDGAYLMGAPEGNRFDKPVSIVKDGKPMAMIRFMENYSEPCIKTAVNDLQEHIFLMTGVKLPVNAAKPKPGSGITTICIGKCYDIIGRPYPYPDDFRELAGTDGFAIRKQGDVIHIFGATDKGAMNGVYTFLENNTDIIWARPNQKFGTICSTGLKNLDFVWGKDVREKPASKLRGYMMWGFGPWMARNRCNVMGAGGGENYWAYANVKPYGVPVFYMRGGHNIGEFTFTDRDKDYNNEFFGLVNGKRERGNHVCFANQEMRKVWIRNFIDAFRRSPTDIAGACLYLDDTWNWCECPGCNAPVKLADGTIVERKDSAYTSTVAFLFFNEIAEAYAKEFPGKKIHIGCYWQTVEPPKCDVHPIIVPIFCPYVRVNDKAPIYAPENIKWLEILKSWAKKVKQFDVRGYNALGYDFPRPLCHTHKRDFQEYFRYSDGIWAESGKYMLDWKRSDVPESAFDYSAIEYWVMTRLYWNPDQDVERLYKYFCYRTFREAAKPMEKFYGTIREEFLRNPKSTTIGETGAPATNDYIIRPGHEEKLRAYLEEAASLAVHPGSKKIIELIRERFEFHVNKVKSAKTPEVSVPLIRVKEKVTFDSAVWGGAAEITEFNKVGKKDKAVNSTSVRVFHDANNLYFKVTCRELNPKDMRRLPFDAKKEIMASSTSHFEIFILNHTDDEIRLFGISPNGNAADFKAYSSKWNSGWHHEVRMLPDGYEGLAIIPFKAIGADLNLAKGKVLRGTIMREVYGKTPQDTERSGWSGGLWHRPDTFGTLTLMR